MSFQIIPAFAQAELEYRQQRVRADFPSRASGSARESTAQPMRRIRLSALFKPRRRPNPVSRRPMPAPHHLTSRG